MERFNLDTWLEDKSREIVTRDGKPARIICYDVKQGKQDDVDATVIALVDKGEEIGEVSYYYSKDGSFLRNPHQTHNLDLFFAEKEESMNEFETRIYNLINFSDPYNYPSIKEVKEEAEILLELAKNEIEKSNPYSGKPNKEWSEEDENKRNGLVKGLEDRMGFGWANQPFTREEYIEWLKSLKERVQPKQEWSEYDNIQLSEAIQMIEANGTWIRSEDVVNKVSNWLKSINPQTRWRPSEEQMEALSEAKLASIRSREYFLGTLYDDLKKL